MAVLPHVVELGALAETRHVLVSVHAVAPIVMGTRDPGTVQVG